MLWEQAPKNEVGVGHRQGAALAVACRSGMRSGRLSGKTRWNRTTHLGANDEHAVLVKQTTASPRRDSIDIELWGLYDNWRQHSPSN
jgi:hypothetical protein